VKLLTEKFEVHEPIVPEGIEGDWATEKSARTNKGLQTRDNSSRFEPYRGDLYQSLPPGTQIESQEVFADSAMPWAGSMDTGSQATDDVNAKSLREGFDRKAMSPTEDGWTREHNDAFYDTVVVDGVEGWIERNNVLDRE
jgi:hypothetical protein